MSDRLQPAFWGGLFIGILSALPIVNAGNCCCCLWVLAGGALAAYLRQQQTPYQIPSSEGALVGLMAGFIGGVVASLLSIPMAMLTGPFQERMMDRILSANPDIPIEIRDALQRAAAGSAMRVAGMLLNVVVDLVFGTLGGLLGAAVFKKKTAPPPPPGTIDVLPPE
jgi:hypothetical protein